MLRRSGRGRTTDRNNRRRSFRCFFFSSKCRRTCFSGLSTLLSRSLAFVHQHHERTVRTLGGLPRPLQDHFHPSSFWSQWLVPASPAAPSFTKAVQAHFLDKQDRAFRHCWLPFSSAFHLLRCFSFFLDPAPTAAPHPPSLARTALCARLRRRTRARTLARSRQTRAR